jgi:uncharacterized protein YydD (DUF2326 family)
LEWDHSQVPIERAILLLDSILELTPIKPWSFRKGVTYFLRKQADYDDPFQISKYAKGLHKEWKPYLAKILGLDDTLLSEKYASDDRIEELEDKKQNMLREVPYGEREYDRIRGTVEIRHHDIDVKGKALDEFDFHQRELDLNESLVSEIESRIAILNNELYNIKFDLEKIREASKSKIQFSLKEITQVFEESGIYFPDALKKSYQDLVAFNRRITQERNKYLQEQVAKLEHDQNELILEHKSLSKRRQEALGALRGTESIRKFKDLQKSLDNDRAELKVLESQLHKLQQVIDLNKTITELRRRRDDLIQHIEDMTRNESETYSRIRIAFNEIIREVLDKEALLSVKVNEQGNLDFHAEFLKSSGSDEPTSEDRGTSYRKMLCMAFDLAVLRAYYDRPFFRFVYHDGAFETLDDRKKLKLLEVIHRSCEEYNIQYLLSAIEDDLPRDADGTRVEFADSEIIKELNDEGEAGRLFRIRRF